MSSTNDVTQFWINLGHHPYIVTYFSAEMPDFRKSLRHTYCGHKNLDPLSLAMMSFMGDPKGYDQGKLLRLVYGIPSTRKNRTIFEKL